MPLAPADFLVNGSPPDALGYDAQPGDELVLQLASAPALDSARVAFTVTIASLDAPDLVFDPPDGRPATPTGKVKVTLPPKGTHSYQIQCEVNEGRNARGQLDPGFTRQRIVAIRSALAGLRKMLPGESVQYAARGWSDEQNREVDQVDEALASIGGNVLAGDGLVKNGAAIEVKATDGSIAVGQDSIGVGVLQSDAQHGQRGGGTTHALASAVFAGFLSPTLFGLLTGATAQALANTLVRRDGGGQIALGALRIGSSDVVADAGALKVRSASGVLTTIASAGAASGGVKLVDEVSGVAQTVGAVTAIAATYTLPPTGIATLDTLVLGIDLATGQTAVIERKARVKRVAGGAAGLMGVPQVVGVDAKDVAAWGATLDVLGPDVRVRVTGAAGNTVAWFVLARVMVLGA